MLQVIDNDEIYLTDLCFLVSNEKKQHLVINIINNDSARALRHCPFYVFRSGPIFFWLATVRESSLRHAF